MWSGTGLSSLVTAIPCLALLSFTGQVLGTENSPGHLHILCPLLAYAFLPWPPSPRLFQIASMPTLLAPDLGLFSTSHSCMNLWDPWIIIHLSSGPWVPWDQRPVGICSLMGVPSSRKEPDKKEALDTYIKCGKWMTRWKKIQYFVSWVFKNCIFLKSHE